jgi:hypothetical protein
MRASLNVALVLIMVGTGTKGVWAQPTDEGWWDWATPLVTGAASGRVATPRTGDERSDPGADSGRDRRPPDSRDERTAEAQRRPAAQPPAAGRGREAQTPQAGRGRGVGRGAANGRGQAGVPAFCRTGAGHPVFGWQWCAERGFAGYRPQWQREPWADAVPRWPRQPRESRIDDRALGGILGDVVFGRVRAHARGLGATEPLEGRWVRHDSGALVLQVRAGDVPVAELSDTSGDGRPNTVIVNRTRR